jgi:hypothetical protein
LALLVHGLERLGRAPHAALAREQRVEEEARRSVDGRRQRLAPGRCGQGAAHGVHLAGHQLGHGALLEAQHALGADARVAPLHVAKDPREEERHERSEEP